MTKQEALVIMRLLSGLEAAGLMRGDIPAYLLEQLTEAVKVLEREILK